MNGLWRLLARPLGPNTFSAIIILIGLAIFAAPLVDIPQLRLIALARTASAKIAIVGPSTIDTFSRCDHDDRSIAQMLQEEALEPVVDLSLPGQTLSQSINIAAISSRNPAISDVVLPITHPATEDWTTPAYREFIAYKLVVPGFRTFVAADLREFWNGISDQPRRIEAGYTFEGNQFPSYATISATEFSREKKLGGCPEVLTHDPAFTKSYFWWTNVQTHENEEFVDLVADLQAAVLKSGKRFHVVVLPSNLELISKLDRNWGEVVRTQQGHFVATLRGRGVDVLDLSDRFRDSEFMQQWCACIHLNDIGRRHVAHAIAATMPIPVGDQVPVQQVSTR